MTQIVNLAEEIARLSKLVQALGTRMERVENEIVWNPPEPKPIEVVTFDEVTPDDNDAGLPDLSGVFKGITAAKSGLKDGGLPGIESKDKPAPSNTTEAAFVSMRTQEQKLFDQVTSRSAQAHLEEMLGLNSKEAREPPDTVKRAVFESNRKAVRNASRAAAIEHLDRTLNLLNSAFSGLNQSAALLPETETGLHVAQAMIGNGLSMRVKDVQGLIQDIQRSMEV